MAEAVAAGLPISDFWDLTYRELFALFKGRNLEAARAHKLALFNAWHAAAFTRQKRLPNLGDMLRKLDAPRVMSPKQVRQAIFAAAKALGAKVRVVEKGKA
jgi:hypothetical protein